MGYTFFIIYKTKKGCNYALNAVYFNKLKKGIYMQSFNRFEEKFIITQEQKVDLVSYFKNYCFFDAFSEKDKIYSIFNIYYDTQNDDIIRHSVSKPDYKEKFRIRSYTYPIKDEDLVFLEIKKKIKGRVIKRRVGLRYKEAINFLECKIAPVFTDYTNNQVLNEISYFLEKNQVQPHWIISYDRMALFAKEIESLRITFDSNIFARPFQNQNKKTKLIDDGLFLMEIKTQNNFPLWLTSKLSELQLYNQSFSKYGTAYKLKFLGDDKNVI